LKMHPVGWLTIAAFEALDPTQFELVRLSAFEQDDYISHRFMKVAPERHDTSLFDDLGAARHIRASGIDILLEMGGYGDNGRMPICAYRAAPVQIKWVGMQYHTSGLEEMDWILCDEREIPPELAHYYTERPLYLPDGYVCYSPPPDAPDVARLPALANGYVTFGCFNNLSKFTPNSVATWAKLLHRLPTARMILKTPQFIEAENKQDMLQRFAACGIGEERLTLRGASPHRTLLAEYGDVDIILDPFPYNGGLTTCEALWMGVPTVTMPGEIFAARHSLSHLSNVGLTDWVAHDIQSYLALAEHKASALPELATLRANLRERVRQSPLCDARRFGKYFGDALRHAWRTWCENG
jgi:predicted O-linked N-acetylglucosamine transferase (SPINDLY family)